MSNKFYFYGAYGDGAYRAHLWTMVATATDQALTHMLQYRTNKALMVAAVLERTRRRLLEEE